MARNETSLSHFNWNTVRKKFTIDLISVLREGKKVCQKSAVLNQKSSRLLVFSISVLSVWCIIYFIFLWKTCIDKGRTVKGFFFGCYQRVRKLARRASQYKRSTAGSSFYGYENGFANGSETYSKALSDRTQASINQKINESTTASNDINILSPF